MALAILRLDDSDDERHVFDVDTGTSPYYRLHLGTEVRREEGFDLLDAHWSSPLRTNPRAGRHFDTRVRAVLPARLVTEPRTFVQLETCRSADGRGRAWSPPVRLPGFVPASSRQVTAMSTSMPERAVAALRPPRMVPVRSAADTFSRPASIADLIGSVVQAAAPVVLNMLNTSGAGASNDPTATLLTTVLRSVLTALAHPPAPGAATPAAGSGGVAPAAPPAASASPPASAPAAPPAAPASPPGSAPAAAAPASVTMTLRNRLVDDPAYAAPLIFGVDDALIGALAGPVLSSVVGPLVQMLPQLANLANQQKLARQALTTQQISDLLSQVDRSMLLQQLIAARSMPVNPGVAGSGPSDADLAALQALLQNAATAPAPTGTPAAGAASPPAVARPASVDAAVARPAPTASRAVLSPVTGPTITRLGSPRVVFVKDQALTLRYRLDVGAAGPATALPRAILDVCVREPGGAVDLLRHSERLTDVTPGSVIKVALTPEECRSLPADTDLEVLAGLRWPTRTGSRQATSSQVLVVSSRVQVRDRGALVGTPVELTDMNRFRAFWNKVWSSPATGAEAVPLWGLDVAMRYSVVLTAADRGNGLMAARLSQEPTDDGVRVSTTGRLKSGLEVGVHELNALLPLFPGEQPLSGDDLAAFAAPGWLATQGGDAVTQARMDGRRGTRGLLWVVPVVALRAFTLAQVTEVDPYGQVAGTVERTVHFPVVESIRVLGLASVRDADETGEAAEVGTSDAPASYRFDGYDVVLNTLVGLEPAATLPRGGA